jgi:hypothetical protein
MIFLTILDRQNDIWNLGGKETRFLRTLTQSYENLSLFISSSGIAYLLHNCFDNKKK